MAPKLLKTNCKFCLRPFFTYEAEKIFCNHKCELKIKRDEFREKKGLKIIETKVHESHCLYCNELIIIADAQGRPRKWCGEICRKLDGKKARAEISNKTDKKKVNLLPYDVLNKIAEKKRVFDDCKYRYQYNRPRI